MNMNLKKIGTVFLLTAGLLGTRNAQEIGRAHV